jgi:ATP-binding cassette subfamily B protein
MSMMRDALAAEAYDREYANRDLMRRLAVYFRPHWRQFVMIVMTVSFLSLASAALPVLIGYGVQLLDDPSPFGQRLALWLVITVLLLGLLSWGANWLRRLLTSRLISAIVLALRHDAFRAVINHDLSFFDKNQSGRVVSRITGDSDEFGRVAVLTTEIVTQLLQIAIMAAYLATVNLLLTGITLLIAPIGFFIGYRFQGIARTITRQSQRAIANVNAAIQEAVTGIRVAKNFRREQGIYEEFVEVNQRSYEIQIKRGAVLSAIFPSLAVFSGLGVATLLYVGGQQAAAGIIGIGAWLVFMNSINEFWFPMTNLSAFWSQFQSALSATERLFALMDAEPAVVQSANRPVAALHGDIRFVGVDFAYEGRAAKTLGTEIEYVLRSFDLHIRPGESIALVGHTGAGKSSIAKLVTRFYEFQAGQLLVDGEDIRRFDLHSYRRQLGIVSQTPFLFAGSVADNIRYATPQLSDAEVEQVARRIGGGEWLETLPDGLQSDVGERGARLSQGQRQLVVLARMLAQDPKIFILDEATASIDPFTEAQIQAALRLLFKNRTSIVIAHRLSTVKAADRILVLRKGVVIEEGSHEQLMAGGGHYAELYNTYFRHQSLEYIESRRASRVLAAER